MVQFPYDVRLRNLLSTLIICTMVVHQALSWRVVLKVGTGQDISPATSIEHLWLSDVTVNDDRVTYVNTRDTVVARYRPTYKSSFINIWEGINLLKMSMYKDGKEAAYLMFNTTGYTRTNFFKFSNIIRSSFTDLSPSVSMAITGNLSRSFELLSCDTGYCGDSRGWMAGVSQIGMGSCYSKEPVPFFMFANKTNSLLNNMNVSDSFAIFAGDCVDQPCLNGGRCTEHLDDFTCHCDSQYYGKTCTIRCPCAYGKCFEVTDSDVTSSGIVIINGTVINNSSFTLDGGRVRLACKCSKGYEGVNCSKNKDDCVGNPCQNSGVCVDKLNGFECDCPIGISGPRCENVSPKEDSNMKTGGVVAAAITVPLVLILIGAMVAYGIYIYKNPEGFGRSTTYKQFTIARDFVRRSFRRVSGRKPRATKRLQEDQVEADPKNEKAGFDNLGFNEATGTGGSVPVYRRENSEMYELSANDQSVVTGPNTSHEKLNINRNQQQQYNKGQEPGVPVERPQRQVGRQGRGKQAEQTQNYNQPTREQQSGNLVVPPVNKPKYQPRQTEAPKAPRSPNDVTTPGYPTQNINTQGRHHDYDSRSLHVNDRSPTSENVPYDRYRDGGSPSSPYGRTYQDYSPRDRAADSAPYDRYRDEHSAPHYHQIDPSQNSYDPRRPHPTESTSYDRYRGDRSPSSPYGPRDYQRNIPHAESSRDRYRAADSPSSPYGENQKSPGWGERNSQDRYRDEPSPNYRGANPADRYNTGRQTDVSSPEQVVFVSADHTREVSI